MEAGAVNLVRTILVLALIFFGVRILVRIVFPWLLKVFFKRLEKRMGERFTSNMAQQKDDGFKKTGNVYVKPSPENRRSKSNVTGGEYVDFEEVKDDE